MNYPKRFILLPALMSLFFVHCKKDADFSPPVTDSTKVTVTAPACRIKFEKSDLSLPQTGNEFTLSYDNAGRLVSVLGTSTGNSTILENATIYEKQIDIEKDGLGPLAIYDFDASIFTGLPDKYTTTRSSLSDKSLTLKYDSLSRVSGVSSYSTSTAAFVESLDVSYDNAGNAVVLTYSFGTGGVQSIYTVSTFDDKHSPYDSLKPSGLLMYNWDFFKSNDVLSVFQHLSLHNPQGFTCKNGTSNPGTSLTYTYNNNGYPTEIRETTTGNYESGPSTTSILWDYAYDCK